MLYFNPLAIKTTQEAWSQVHSSKFRMIKDLSKALKYDLLVKNPHDLIVNNSKDVLFADNNISKTKRAAAGAIVVLSSIYTIIMYGSFVYSFGSSLRTIAVFTNSKKIELAAYAVMEVGSRAIHFGSFPAQYLFYKIPKGILFGFPSFVSNSINKASVICKFVFDNFLTPLFKIIKKVLVWNYLQLVMAVRIVFDHTAEAFNWARHNVFSPFWKVSVEPRVNLLKETLKGYNVFAG